MFKNALLSGMFIVIYSSVYGMAQPIRIDPGSVTFHREGLTISYTGTITMQELITCGYNGITDKYWGSYSCGGKVKKLNESDASRFFGLLMWLYSPRHS